MNTQPAPGRLRTWSVPPFASTLRRLMGNPRPRPGASSPSWANGRKISSALPSGEAATFVLDVDQKATVDGVGVEGHATARPGERDGVLQDVRHRRREDLSVALDGEALLDGRHDEFEVLGRGIDRGGHLHVGDEVHDHDSLPTRREPGSQTHVDERPVDEVTQPDQAAIEQGARGSP